MNATWVKKLVFSALGCALASGTVAMAGSFAVTVDFSCADGSGTGSGGSICNPGNPVGAVPLSQWTQGFTGSSGAGAVKVGGVSNSVFGFSLNNDYGDPAPPSVGGPAGTQNLTVTDAGDYLFSFAGIDLGSWSNNHLTYTITGWNQGTQEFTETVNIQPCTGTAQACGTTYNWEWIAGNSDWLTELTITTNSGSSVLADSLEENVTPAPEPGSLFLLGTGLAGLAFVAFRKSRTANLSL